MPRTYLTAVAVLSLAVSACAHTAADSTARAGSYLGGRAGQPGGWPAQLTAHSPRSPNERLPSQPDGHASYLGGRAAQPAGWVEPPHSDQLLPEALVRYAYQGGRAGQPHGWPDSP